MRKDDLLTFLINQTDFFDPHEISETFTTSHLAQRFGLQRNTASHYLNQLVAEGVLIKINTRPVYFLHKTSFEQQFYPLSYNEFTSVAELLADDNGEREQRDHFSLLIGHQGSLKKPIEQLKTALFYPDNGLPLLITGDSGTGKSYMAQLMHEYAITHGLISASAPFVTFNCAQYASNPELLAANLFGYVKGAFTGANSDKTGAFEAADGGILFLDEVHRLHAEGQEKLFTWLDKGEIYRVGETAGGHRVSVRLVFATTEDIHSTFLTTFIRRIPIHVALPELESRSRKEKEALILQFFWLESKKVGLGLRISSRLLSVLAHYVFRGNVGELKNVIKYTVASSFARLEGGQTLKVTIHDLPESVMAQFPALNEAMTGQHEDIELDENTSLPWLLHAQDAARVLIHDVQLNVLTLFEKYRSVQLQWEDAELRIGNEIEALFDRLIFDNQDQACSQMLLLITSQVREEFYRLEKSYSIQFNGNCIYALGHYLVHRSNVEPARINAERCKQFERFLEQKYPLLYLFCEEVLASLTRRLDLRIQGMDRILLLLWLNKTSVQISQLVTKAVILAHGYATASSIANVANRLLKQTVYESFDMPLDVTPQVIAQQVTEYVERNAQASSLVILVDMGSLNDIHQYFSHKVSMPVTIINNVSTRMALYVGERILQGDYLETIACAIAKDFPVEHKTIWPELNKPKAIITTCATGIGAASNLCSLLKASIPQELGIEVVAYEYETLAQNKKGEPIFSRFDVLALVGTLDPRIADVPYISLDTLISGQGNEVLLALFGDITSHENVMHINECIVKNFSLRRVIESVTILDTSKVINQVEQFLARYQHLTAITLPNDRKVALYIHVSCLIERLIRQAAIQSYAGCRGQCQRNHLAALREAFSVIETSYSVKIPEAELFYIHDILHVETEFLQYDQEF
jgi:sigma-54 dependent transcriptional regulator of gfr operon